MAYNAELYHYGIKGMKWGVRRYQNEDGSYTSLGKERRRVEYSDDYKRASELKNRDPRSLSNKELSELNTRMQLEDNYARLMASGKKKSDGLLKQYVNKTASQLKDVAAAKTVKWVTTVALPTLAMIKLSNWTDERWLFQ